MNLKKSLQFRQEDGDLWFPVTPQKPIVWDSNPSTVELQGSQTISNNFPEVLGSSSPIATSMQGNQAGNENWEELIGIYSELLQQTTKSKCDGIQNSCTLQQTSSNAFPIPYQSSCNLDSPPRKQILGASHTTNCSEIAPLTPDQGKQLKSYELSVVHEFSVDGSLNHEKDTQGITSTDGKEVRIQSDQLLQCVIASPSPSKSRSLKDKNVCEDGGYGGIDLITLTDGKDVQIHPDQLLQSVIASPSPSNSASLKDKNICEDGSHGGIDLNKTPQQLKTPKRKKHRPKVVVEGKSKRTPKPMPLKTQNSTSSGKRKYVRKNGLRDSTSQDDNEAKPVGAPSVQSAVKSCRRVLNFGKEAKVQDLGTISSMGLNRMSTIPAAKEEQQKRYSAETQQSESICNLLNATNQTSPDKFLPLSATAPPTAARDHTLNVIARSINLKNAMAYQSQNQLGYSKVHQQIHGEATSQMPLHPNTAWPKLEAKQLMLQRRIESINCMAEPNEKRRHRRDYCNISDLAHCPTVQLMHLKFNGKPMNDRRKPGIDNSESHGKRQFEDTLHEAACTMSVNQCLRQIESRGNNMIHVISAPYNNDKGNAQYNNERKNSPWQQTSSASGIGTYQYKDPRVIGKFFQEQRYLSEVKLQGDCMAGQFFQQHTESHTPSLLTGITNRNMLSPPQKVPITTQTIKTRTPEDHKAMKRQMLGLESSLLELSKERVLPKHYKKQTGYLPFSRKARGKKEKQVHAINIDEITCQLKQMQISKSTKALVRKKQTALVPYEGDKAIVPYREFDPIKRRKLRPRVDLDPETNQLWDLLMGKQGSESAETIGKDKEKWWENEREVFRGRVDSFIARMHLVQGDRRFSRWKGSVVDSVIGVFLTQNVTDHLSSSVFMSLAAEFPLPRTVNLASEWEEPEVQIIDPDGTITFQDRRIRRPLHKHKSRASSGSSEQKSGYVITEAGIHLVKENNRTAEEEVFSSQNSSESLILQTNGEIQSSSDSEVEDQVILCSANKIQSLKYTLQTDRAASVQQHQIPETRSPLMDNRPMLECKKQPSLACISQDSAPNIGGNVYGYPINSNIQHSEGSFAQSQTGLMNHCSGGGPSGSESNKIPKKRKRKVDEKTKPFDWDTLRKQVLLKGGKQKRCKDRMDSLNYDALRNADVNQISDIIKERGMNNMLAGRIKAFLDRLVRDHGSIDLEWLRDVSPDKAKEFLLSIQGLGLKSVECVRLLTLHHMAFPVDTNVGRIAVRLGWVPLQPLPESLQLHLLELYPVLESIQKYLWPRLCKLDQRTLYELHYQMITFGKVFCTKSKPNCNACPMRAECRHFASAFASTRLALPGPEERSIVSLTIPTAPNETPTLILKPMPLPPPENSIVRKLQYISSQQEPIIEEPTTPEAFTEFSESDIEDILSQDTDEIPTIDLSLEELKMNVKEFMKDRNVGIPEAALSKALVALNSADASIPAPKLKNVNRLRTEHQVYEIPDSHPLLEGMDRREPDDPSPYLLAIWTPGETANSTQPPESKCGFQGTGKLCNDKTCFACNNVREANLQIVRGTILIPCRTATRGSFPLNGTYFQVNEVFADHESSASPINVPRDWLWPLARRTVYFGTSVSAIFRGLSTTGIQYCFWRGFVCVRGFDRKARSPKPLTARLHYPASKKPKNKNENKEKQR